MGRKISRILVGFALAFSVLSLSGQEPPLTLRGPDEDVTVKAEASTICFVDGKWLRIEPEAVRKTQAVVNYKLESKPEDLLVIVERYVIQDGAIVKQLGQAENVPTDSGVEFRLTVPGSGLWYVTIHDYATRRHYPLTVQIGEAPKPPPDPPDGDDGDDDGDAPFVAQGFAVLILKEASETGSLPPSQVQIFTAAEIHRYCTTNAVKLSDGKPFYRQWDDDYTEDQFDNVPHELKLAYQKVTEAADSLPWIAIVGKDGKSGYSGPLPTTVSDTLTLLKKWGG